MSGKKPKSVSFNEKTSKREKELLEWIEADVNCFASLVKDLLFAEMMRRKEGLRITHKSKNGTIRIKVMGNTPSPSKVSV
ncbi:hypothetical protein [Neobacillus niacini]|uniref:hypothetical protein n=1 Tax=Neobacillus niacini TaxID=86668 RepID=UPI002FFFE874